MGNFSDPITDYDSPWRPKIKNINLSFEGRSFGELGGSEIFDGFGIWGPCIPEANLGHPDLKNLEKTGLGVKRNKKMKIYCVA